MPETKPEPWRDVLLNTDGEDLIYETPGDERRGHPLDITGVVTVNGGETVLGLKFPRKAVAKELARRWNHFPRLLAAAKAMHDAVTRLDSPSIEECLTVEGDLAAAIDAAESE